MACGHGTAFSVESGSFPPYLVEAPVQASDSLLHALLLLMILTGEEIKAQLGKNIVIEPFDVAMLNPNSYNLSLHDELLVYEEIVLDVRRPNRYRRHVIPPEGFVLQPGQLYLGRTVERTETLISFRCSRDVRPLDGWGSSFT